MRARLPRRFRSSCTLTGTQATASAPSTETTSVLKSRCGSMPSFSAASSPYDAALGSCSYSCSENAMPASAATRIAGVAAMVDTVRPDDRGHHGQDRLAVPPPRLRLPVLGDLRRPRVDVRLRPLRRPPVEPHPLALVSLDGVGARRHRCNGLG